MKIEGKFILKVAGTLTAISLVVAALLGATNALTEDKIAAINKANTEVALAAVVSSPDCAFPPIEQIPPKRAASAPRASPMRRPPPAPARSISSSASPARARSSSRPTSTPFPARP